MRFPEIVSKDLRVTKEICFEISDPSLFPSRFANLKIDKLNELNCKIRVVDAQIM